MILLPIRVLFNNVPRIGQRGAHFRTLDIKMRDMHVKVMPALRNNYMYMLICRATREAAIVDPVDADQVLRAVKAERVRLRKILTTHHHADHAGGNPKMVKHIQDHYNLPLEVFGNDDRIPEQIFKAEDGRCFRVGKVMCRCLTTPCHTKGHVCYYAMTSKERAVFTGDTLFQGGVGTFNEGTAEQMYVALFEKLDKLPYDTKVFSGHENALDNLNYARHVEPNNTAVANRIEWVRERLAIRAPTVPSTIGQERSWNPFMRVHNKIIQRYAKKTDAIATLGFLRSEKDSYIVH